ncbi:MAG: hypothetical protein KCHDKBKB_01101 [Elusimicrobia bacterium]|nr:hypothetical protein [Elusimicrobiota bacterium]
MILTETNVAFPLSSVKPLDGLRTYRQFCIETTKKVLAGKSQRRERSLITGSPLVPAGTIEGLEYSRCPDTDSLFLSTLPESAGWASLLKEVNQRRLSPNGFHSGVVTSRDENVYRPKIDWIESTLQMQGVEKPSLMELAGPTSRFTALLKSSGLFRDVIMIDEMDLILGSPVPKKNINTAVMLESLDHVDDPQKLLERTHDLLAPGGILFLTSLVASGFDMALLGFDNLYFCPPDRTNCFTLRGLENLLKKSGFTLLEISTPGVLDVEIVQAHLNQKLNVSLSPFERELMTSDGDVKQEFQKFLQKGGLSSFARIVGRKN